MRILIIHNYYQQPGGEDAAFSQEVALLRRHGFTVKTMEFTNDGFGRSLAGLVGGALKSLYNPVSARQVEEVIADFDPDVMHIHNLFYTASPSVIQIARQWSVPVVMTLHNYRLVCNNGLLMRSSGTPCESCLSKTIPLDGIRHGCFRNSALQSAQLTAITSLHKLTGLWRSVDRYIVLTEFARRKILESSLNLTPEQVVVKPNSIAQANYVQAAPRADNFLYVGRLSSEKGISVLLDAARMTDRRIDIVGDGPMRTAVEELAASQPNLRYLGKLSQEQVRERMRNCRALLVPSVWYEGLPTVILEAFASGTPVICSDQQNLNSIVRHGRTGHLFETGNAASLATALQTITDAQCARYGQAGLDQFNLTYTEQASLRQLSAIYASVQKKTYPIASDILLA